MNITFGRFVRVILGFDNTEIPEKQVKYLSDIAKTRKDQIINEENLAVFIETLKDKHEIEDVSVFRKGMIIFSSENDDFDKINKVYELFEKTKSIMDKKLLMIKDKHWICVFEKEGFTFVVKKLTKLSEIELNAITYDTLKRLDKILLEEKSMLENSYQLNLNLR